jgi:hypothetical protein
VIDALARQPQARLRSVARAATVMTGALLGVIIWLGLPLWTEQAPLGIVSLQFAASPEAASAMLESWARIPRSRLLWAHGLDLLLSLAYAVAIVAAATRIAAESGRTRRAASLAAGAALVAAIADQVENLAIAVSILSTPTWSGVLITLVAATVKSTLLVVALVSLLIGSRQKLRR